MSQATEPREAEGVAEDRAQRALTSRVGATLVRRSKPSKRRWSAWSGRLGIRRKREA
jgi:hypothetical protein